MKFVFLALVLAALAGVWAAGTSSIDTANLPAIDPKVPPGAEVITLGAGCFWRGGAIFPQIPGVLSVTAGYMGGTTEHPSYEEVAGGGTGHTEVSRIVFDPQRTSLAKILEVFWAAHHPTVLNSAHGRSVIFYTSGEQRQAAVKSKADASRRFSQPVVTEILAATEFYAAEKYHQDYCGVQKNGAGSCNFSYSAELKALGIK